MQRGKHNWATRARRLALTGGVSHLATHVAPSRALHHPLHHHLHLHTTRTPLKLLHNTGASRCSMKKLKRQTGSVIVHFVRKHQAQPSRLGRPIRPHLLTFPRIHRTTYVLLTACGRVYVFECAEDNVYRAPPHRTASTPAYLNMKTQHYDACHWPCSKNR